MLCGHLHARSTRVAGRLLQLGLGSLIEPPHEFSIIELCDGADAPLVTRMAVEAPSAAGRGPALSPGRESWRFDRAEQCWETASTAAIRPFGDRER